MFAPQSRPFSTSMTCMLSRPEGLDRSRPEWCELDEENQNDFRDFRSCPQFAKEAEELSSALEQYKLIHRRRCLSFEEIIAILHSLGYRQR